MEAVIQKHIESIPGVCGGKPCVVGTRIRVWDIHVWHDLHGQTPEEIVVDFPQLTVSDVHAALAFYHDNRELLEEQNRDAETLVRCLSPEYPSKLPARDGPVSS